MTRFLLGTGGAFGILNQYQINNLIDKAISVGINSFDSGSNYAYGKAETLLGNALKKYKREDFYISTKAGKVYDSLRKFHKDFSFQNIQKSCNKSLQNLNIDYLDTFYLQGPKLDHIDNNLINLLQNLKANKKIINLEIN